MRVLENLERKWKLSVGSLEIVGNLMESENSTLYADIGVRGDSRSLRSRGKGREPRCGPP